VISTTPIATNAEVLFSIWVTSVDSSLRTQRSLVWSRLKEAPSIDNARSAPSHLSEPLHPDPDELKNVGSGTAGPKVSAFGTL